jgi:carbamoyl-phosphate synthase large subunit
MTQEPKPRHVAVKEVVLPFNKFPGADTLLGPEMRSTGEVMGIDYDFASSYAKAQIAAGQKLPMSGMWLWLIYGFSLPLLCCYAVLCWRVC